MLELHYSMIEFLINIIIIIMITEILEGIRKIVKKLVCIIMLSVNNATDIFLVIWSKISIHSAW